MATATVKTRAARAAQEEARAALIAAAQEAEEVAYRDLLRDDTYNGDQLSESLSAIYAQMGMEESNAADVHVSKLDARGDGIEMGIWKGAPEDYDLESLAKSYGSGQFRVKLYVKMPGGPKVMRGNRIFPWLLSPEQEAKRVAKPEPVQAALTAADVARIVAETMRTMMQQAAPVAPPLNPMTQMKELAEVMRTLQPPPQPAGAGLGQVREIVELLGMMRDSADPIERSTNASTTDLLMRVVDKFGPALGGILQQQQAAALPTVPAIAAASAPVPSSEAEMINAQQMQIKVGLNFLVSMAVNDAPPETYAGVVMDYVPAENLRQLLAVPSGPVTALAQMDPRVNEHRAWFEAVFAEVKTLLETPEDSKTENGEQVKEDNKP